MKIRDDFFFRVDSFYISRLRRRCREWVFEFRRGERKEDSRVYNFPAHWLLQLRFRQNLQYTVQDDDDDCVSPSKSYRSTYTNNYAWETLAMLQRCYIEEEKSV